MAVTFQVLETINRFISSKCYRDLNVLERLRQQWERV